jgi:pimeloyl-ACP methyl ester carboxylesterase
MFNDLRLNGRSFAFLPAILAMAPYLAAAAEPAAATFVAKGVKLRYITAGDNGSTVVLLHGLNANADLNWRLPGMIKTLAAEHRVVAIDFPGHGGSDKPEEDDAYGRQMSEDVALLLDHLKVDKAHIVGYSMGGMVALRFLADHPDRCLSSVLAGMGWLQEGSPLQQFWARVPDREGARTPAACPRGMAKLALSETELKAVKTPVTVIVGDGDPVKRLYVEPLQNVRNDWPVVEIADAGHFTCAFKPAFVDAVVRSVKD